MIDIKAVLAEHAVATLAAGGLVVGLIFGAVAQRTGFCTLGAISDWTLFGDTKRARAWLLAIAVALAGTQLLNAAAIVDLDRSLYRAASFQLGGHVVGGLLFGFGMVLAGGCVSRNLVRAGSGDLRAWMTLLCLGIFVMITLGGVLGPLRVTFLSSTSFPRTPALSPSAGMLLGLAASIAIVAVCLADAAFRAARHHVFAGLLIGLCVVAGWALTGLAYDEFADMPVDPQSLTFVKPVADGMDWLKRATALGAPGFAVMSVAGTVLGSFLAAVSSGQFRLSTFADAPDTLRNLVGAILMGIGGVLAMGCSIGQGITGISTLSLGSLISLVAIVMGAIAGLKASERYSILT